jgi:hypothetical protein
MPNVFALSRFRRSDSLGCLDYAVAGKVGRPETIELTHLPGCGSEWLPGCRTGRRILAGERAWDIPFPLVKVTHRGGE